MIQLLTQSVVYVLSSPRAADYGRCLNIVKDGGPGGTRPIIYAVCGHRVGLQSGSVHMTTKSN